MTPMKICKSIASLLLCIVAGLIRRKGSVQE